MFQGKIFHLVANPASSHVNLLLENEQITMNNPHYKPNCSTNKPEALVEFFYMKITTDTTHNTPPIMFNLLVNNTNSC